MQAKPKLVSFLNQVFLDIKPKDSAPTAESSLSETEESTSLRKHNTLTKMEALDNALALIQTFPEAVPHDLRRSIVRQALAQQGEGQIDQVLLEATLRKAQLAQNPANSELDTRLAELNAELERLWDLRDQRQEESKRIQWALQQESDQLDQVLTLLVGSPAPAEAPSPSTESGTGRNPRRLSALATPMP